jgi:hypothetical protein
LRTAMREDCCSKENPAQSGQSGRVIVPRGCRDAVVL